MHFVWLLDEVMAVRGLKMSSLFIMFMILPEFSRAEIFGTLKTENSIQFNFVHTFIKYLIIYSKVGIH